MKDRLALGLTEAAWIMFTLQMKLSPRQLEGTCTFFLDILYVCIRGW